MKKIRRQIVGNIQFIVESNFKNGNAFTAKLILTINKIKAGLYNGVDSV